MPEPSARPGGAISLEARNKPVREWLGWIDTGHLQLPRFQRFEAWGYREVGDLLESVLNGLPAGAALVLEAGDAPLFQVRQLSGAPRPSSRVGLILLDGQQRLTALHRTLRDDYPDRTFFVDLAERNEAGGLSVTSLKRSMRGGIRYPLWAEKPEEVFGRNLLPVTLLRPGIAANALAEWLRAALPGDPDRVLDELTGLAPLQAAIAEFNLPFLSLPSATDKSEVIEVFVKMNTNTVPLSAFDIIVADVEGEIGASLHDLLDGLRGVVPGLARYGDLGDIVLRAAALYEDRAPDRPGIMAVDWTRILDDWPELVEGARQAVEFLESEKVFDAARLPVYTVVPALLVLWSRTAGLSGDQVGNARTLFRKFIYRAFFTDRYESSAHTHVIQDVRALIGLIRNDSAALGQPPIFSADLPELEDPISAGWPKKRDRLARAILCLSFKGDARDLADGAEITAASAGLREYHHLYPRGFLGETVDRDGGDRALNCALITWRTNRTISAKPPVEYLKDRAEAHTLGSDEVLDRLRTHAIPGDALEAGDYPTFLAARAEIIKQGMDHLCSGKPWRPS